MVIKGYSSLFPAAVMSQEFKAHVDQESYVILGNDAVLKCDIPSFVADLVLVVSWHDSQGNVFHMGRSFDGKWHGQKGRGLVAPV